jgi:hypothetical protein
MATEFITTLKSGGDWSDIQSAINGFNCDLTAATTKVIGISNKTGAMPEGTLLHNADESKNATVVCVNAAGTQALLINRSGAFTSIGERFHKTTDTDIYFDVAVAEDTAHAVIDVYGNSTEWTNTGAIVVDGWGTSANNKVKIRGASGYRASAKWNSDPTVVATIKSSSNGAGAQASLEINENGFELSYLQFWSVLSANLGTSAFHGINYNVSGGQCATAINHNFIRGQRTTYTCQNSVGVLSNLSSGGQVHTLYRNVITGFKNTNNANICAGVFLYNGGIWFVNSNTFYNNSNTHVSSAEMTPYPAAFGYIKARNNILQTETNSHGAIGAFDAGTDYNATNQAAIGYTVTGSGNTHDHTSHTFTFVDAANLDFNLALNDAGAIDLGTDLSGDTYTPHTTDLGGQTISGTWDIGADERMGFTGVPPFPCFRP